MNKNVQFFVKAILIILILIISILSGISFRFPESWQFSTNVLVMSKTFLHVSIAICLFNITHHLEKYLSVYRKGK